MQTLAVDFATLALCGVMMGCVRKVSSFIRREEGVSAIEFAVVAPTLLLLLFGTIEFSLIMMVRSVMEGATAASSRLGKTGYTADGKTREETILQAVTDRAGALIDTSKLTIQSKFYKEFQQINDPEPYTDANTNGTYDLGETFTDINGNTVWDADMATSGYGSAGDIVVYTISYPWTILTPITPNFIGTEGVVTITTHAVVKNEPYN